MRVSRLEVFGFKSFMDRLVLPLEVGITGVVGPNGCGKSNIVDAIRWVLGETKASNLRGGTLEDVIFNGTDKLRPLGLAEVTLTLRAQQENFFADLVSPQLEVEQVLKNLETELKHQEDILGAKEGIKLRVVEGRLSKATSEAKATSEDIIDEVEDSTEKLDATIIDISSFRDQSGLDPALEIEKEETQEEISTSVLARFSWLKSVSEVQITRRLYRSGESEFFINRVACRLKDIKDFFRAIGLGARAYTIVAQGEVSRIVTAKPEERRAIIEEAAGVIGFKDKIAASNRKLDETAHSLARLNDVISEVERQVQNLKRQASRAENRQNLKDEIQKLELLIATDKFASFGKRVEALKVSFNEQQIKLNDSEIKIQELSLKEESAKSELIILDSEADSLRLQIDSRRDELLSRARKKAEKQSRINEIRAFNLARQTEIKRLEERKEVLKTRFSEADSGIEQLKAQETVLIEETNKVHPVSEEELKNVAHQLKTRRDELKQKETEIRIIRDKVVSHQSSIQAMHEQIIAASPLEQLQKSLSDQDISTLREKTAVFVEGLSVPFEYTKAVQSILSERASFLVAENPEELASAFLKSRQNKDSQNKKGMGIGILKRGSSELSAKKDVPFERMLDCIQVKDDFSFAANNLLTDVYIAPTSEDAFNYFRSESVDKGQVTVVTMDGEIHTQVSFFSLRHEGGLISLQAKVRQLQESLVGLDAQYGELQQLKDALQEDVLKLESKQSELLKESEIRQKTLRELSSQLSTVRGRLHAEIRQVDQIKYDIDKTTNLIQEVINKISESRKEEESILATSENNSEGTLEATLEEEVRSFTTLLQQVDIKRKDGRAIISAVNEEYRRIQQSIDTLRNSMNRDEIALQKLVLEQQHIEERLLQEYGEQILSQANTIPEQYEFLSSENILLYENEAQKIRSRIIREGEVDSSSIERYKEEDARLIELQGQRKDLEEAVSMLKRTIVRLEEVSKHRFVAMFNSVSKNFSRLIPQLFGGGKGNLSLTDPSKPLESGIDILMRPPGKKPKSIDLLSGGEKALCATALIFSIFLEKPSPLCVLDEVDAPLDEANLIRFLSLVKEMSNRTQFLLVTHNKRSMSSSDNLVGVTQEEPGASKIISVSLNEAFSQVA